MNNENQEVQAVKFDEVEARLEFSIYSCTGSNGDCDSHVGYCCTWGF